VHEAVRFLDDEKKEEVVSFGFDAVRKEGKDVSCCNKLHVLGVSCCNNLIILSLAATSDIY
jgi:hypothetical protein